jgi:diguanylate cyclase (GGDEF)-like protein
MKPSRRNTIKILILICILISLVDIAFCRPNAREASQKLTNRGTQLLQQGKLEEALRDFREAIKADPTYDVPHAKLAEWYINCYKKDEAIQSYLQAIRLNRGKPAYYYQIGGLYFDKEEYTQALKFYEMGQQIDQNNPKFYFVIGNVHNKQDNKEKARESYEAVLSLLDAAEEWKDNDEITSIYWKTHFELGLLEKYDENWDEAINHFKLVEENARETSLKTQASEELNELKFKNLGKLIQSPAVLIPIASVIAIFILILIISKLKKTKKPKEAPKKAEEGAVTITVLADYAAEHFAQLTEMPKALIYFAVNEAEPLKLYKTVGMDTDPFDALAVNWSNMNNWMVFSQSQPFMFDVQKNESQFTLTFPNGKEILEEAGARIGIPFTYEGAFQGIAFLCYPNINTSEKQRLKTIYIKNIEQIRKKAVEIGKKTAIVRINETSLLDDITPAFNSSYFYKRIHEEFTKCKENNKHLALLMLECEGVDVIAKQQSEDKRKYMINLVYQALQIKVESNPPLIFRVFENRFAIILPDYNVIEAREKCLHLMDVIANLDFKDSLPRITTGAGLAVFPEHAQDSGNLERMAGNAVDQAVRLGKGKLVVGTEVDTSRLEAMSGLLTPKPIQHIDRGTKVFSQESGKFPGTPPSIPPPEINKEPQVISPSGKLRMSQPAKTPISIAPPPEDSTGDILGEQEPTGRKQINITPGSAKKPDTPFTFRSAQKQPPTIAKSGPSFAFGDQQNTRLINAEEPPGTNRISPNVVPTPKSPEPRKAITSFDDLWGGGESSGETEIEERVPESPSGRLMVNPDKPHFIPPRPEGGTSSLKPKVSAPNSSSPKSLKPERKPKRVLSPKASDGKSETSILRRATISHESGSSTSKLSQSSMSEDNDTGKKPMAGLIRRSKAPDQVPSLQDKPAFKKLSPPGDATINLPPKTRIILDDSETESYPTTETKTYPTQEMMVDKKAFYETQEIPREQQPDKTSGSGPLAKIGPKSFKDLQPRINEISKDTDFIKSQAKKDQEAVPVRNKQTIPSNFIEPVTGFFYKSFFENNIGKLMTRAKQTRKPLCLLFFKLDRHKELKTKYGQEKLNNVLREISSMIKNFLKEGSDIPARYSDEIFVIILSETSHQIAFNLAEQIRFTVGNLNFSDIPAQITLSLGVSSFPDKSHSPKEIMKNAYNALVYAIKNGGNRTIIWDDKLQI